MNTDEPTHIDNALEDLYLELEEAVRTTEHAQTKVARANAEQIRADDRLSLVERAIENLISLQLDPSLAPKATTADLVLLVLDEARKPLKDDEIMRRIIELGWMSDAKDRLANVGTNLSRLRKREQVVFLRDRMWVHAEHRDRQLIAVPDEGVA